MPTNQNQKPIKKISRTREDCQGSVDQRSDVRSQNIQIPTDKFVQLETSYAADRRSPLSHSSASWSGKVIFLGCSLSGKIFGKKSEKLQTLFKPSLGSRLMCGWCDLSPSTASYPLTRFLDRTVHHVMLVGPLSDQPQKGWIRHPPIQKHIKVRWHLLPVLHATCNSCCQWNIVGSCFDQHLRHPPSRASCQPCQASSRISSASWGKPEMIVETFANDFTTVNHHPSPIISDFSILTHHFARHQYWVIAWKQSWNIEIARTGKVLPWTLPGGIVVPEKIQIDAVCLISPLLHCRGDVHCCNPIISHAAQIQWGHLREICLDLVPGVRIKRCPNLQADVHMSHLRPTSTRCSIQRCCAAHQSKESIGTDTSWKAIESPLMTSRRVASPKYGYVSFARSTREYYEHWRATPIDQDPRRIASCHCCSFLHFHRPPVPKQLLDLSAPHCTQVSPARMLFPWRFVSFWALALTAPLPMVTIHTTLAGSLPIHTTVSSMMIWVALAVNWAAVQPPPGQSPTGYDSVPVRRFFLSDASVAFGKHAARISVISSNKRSGKILCSLQGIQGLCDSM